jgi:chromosome partitioning protein
MRTVLVANAKGGVDKTLIAAMLASALARRGDRVALADADRQQSALGWLERRPDSVAHIRGLDWSRGSAIGEHPARLDWLVIDAPGALKGSKAEALVAEATAVLAPVQPSVFDENAARRFLEDIDEIKRVRKGRVAMNLVANRLRTGSRAAQSLDDFFARIERPALARIAERAVYADPAAGGLGIFDRELSTLEPIKQQWQPIFDF